MDLEQQEEEGRETLNSCEKDGDAVVEKTNQEDSSPLHKEAALEDRVRNTQIAEERGPVENSCEEKRFCEETPTGVSEDSNGKLVTDEAGSGPEDSLCTQTVPTSQDSLHQAT